MFCPFIIKSSVITQLQRTTGTTISTKEDQDDLLRKSQLRSYLSSTDGLINGKTLKELWFPHGKYQIFLSHSHNDIELARYLKAWFKVYCNLDCFIDADVWSNAFVLLKELDNKYSIPAGTTCYNYDRRNQSTAHVYAMLTMALFEAIDEIECPILIESANSVTLKEGIEKSSLSPWIYEEVGYMGKLPHKIPSRFPTTRCFSVGAESMVLNESVTDSLQMTHPLDTTKFKQIDNSDLLSMRSNSGLCALDVLYKRKLLFRRYAGLY